MRLALLTVALLSSLLVGAVPANRSALSVPLAVYVQGAGLVDQSGAPLVLRGADRAGAEYNCMNGKTGQGLLDGPSDQASIDAMKAVGLNAVRVPLNEDCLLGINPPPAGNAYIGAAYEQNLTSYVNLLTSNGMVAILDLHWNAPGTYPAGQQQPMPDMDHAPAFWREMARLFSSNPAVIFDLFNEGNPFPCCSPDFTTWQRSAFSCVRDGCTVTGKVRPWGATADSPVSYQGAGMQLLVDTIRSTGATNVLMIGGIQAAETITQYRGNTDTEGNYMPTDPLNQLAVSVHAYPADACGDLSCYTSTYLPVARVYPIIAGEVGESGQACPGTFTATWDAFAAQNKISTIGWTWNVWSNNGVPSCDSLITDYTGAPNGAYGQSFVRGLALFQATPITGTATPGSQPTIIQATPLSATATITPSATLVPELTATITPTDTLTPVPANSPTDAPTVVQIATATVAPSSTPVSPTRTATASPSSTAPPAPVPSMPPLPSPTPLKNITIPGMTCFAQTTLFLGRHWYACIPGG